MKITKENRKEKFFNKISLYGISVCGVLVGIIMILLSQKYENYASILALLGQSITSISASSILIEWFGYVNYTRNRLSEILVEDEVLNVLDMKRKRELKSALIKNIYMPNMSLEENNIATIVDDEMDKVLKGYYYEEFITYVDAYKIQDENNIYFLKKDIRITFTAKSVNGERCIVDTLISMCLDPIESESLKPLELNKLLVNGKNLTEYFKYEIARKCTAGDLKGTYPTKFVLDRTNKNFKKYMNFSDTIYIDMEYSTIVNMDDLLYSYQIDKACKHYCIHFNIKSDEFDLAVIGFGFMSLGNNKRQRCIKTNNGYMLRFLDWILPGDGVSVVLKEKEKNNHENG